MPLPVLSWPPLKSFALIPVSQVARGHQQRRLRCRLRSQVARLLLPACAIYMRPSLQFEVKFKRAKELMASFCSACSKIQRTAVIRTAVKCLGTRTSSFKMSRENNSCWRPCKLPGDHNNQRSLHFVRGGIGKKSFKGTFECRLFPNCVWNEMVVLLIWNAPFLPSFLPSHVAIWGQLEVR